MGNDVKSKICGQQGCMKQPSYGVDSSRKPSSARAYYCCCRYSRYTQIGEYLGITESRHRVRAPSESRGEVGRASEAVDTAGWYLSMRKARGRVFVSGRPGWNH